MMLIRRPLVKLPELAAHEPHAAKDTTVEISLKGEWTARFPHLQIDGVTMIVWRKMVKDRHLSQIEEWSETRTEGNPRIVVQKSG